MQGSPVGTGDGLNEGSFDATLVGNQRWWWRRQCGWIRSQCGGDAEDCGNVQRCDEQEKLLRLLMIIDHLLRSTDFGDKKRYPPPLPPCAPPSADHISTTRTAISESTVGCFSCTGGCASRYSTRRRSASRSSSAARARASNA